MGADTQLVQRESDMGIFYARVGVSDGNGGATEWVNALVDTGATYSVLPASLLRDRVGVSPETHLVFTFANGDQERLPVGQASFKYGDTEATSRVVFGSDGQYLLGATTLQMLGLIADTTEHRLLTSPKFLI